MKRLLITLFVATAFISFGQVFEDNIQNSGINSLNSIPMATVDFNNDYFTDLITRSNGGSDYQQYYLWKNNGNGTFTDVTSLYNYPQGKYIFPVNIDNDLYVDIISVICDSLRIAKFNGVEFLIETYNFGIQVNNIIDFGDFNLDGQIDVFAEVTFNDNTRGLSVFFNNYQKCYNQFNQRTDLITGLPANVSIRNGNVGDLDNDGDLDFICTERTGGINSVQATKLYENVNGNYINVTATSGIGNNSVFEWLTWDYDNNGHLDLLIGSGDSPPNVRSYQNNLNMSFSNVSSINQLHSGNHYYYPSVVDFDNDFDQDVFHGISSVNNHLSQLYINNNGSFQENAVGYNLNIYAGPPNAGGVPGVGSPCWIDIENDGDLDLFYGMGDQHVNNNARLLINPIDTNTNRFIDIKLVGCQSPRIPWGAKVKLKVGSNYLLIDHDYAGTSSARPGPFFHFGVGNTQVIDSLYVFWPSGNTSVMSNVATNQILTIEEIPGCYNPIRRGAISVFSDVDANCIQYNEFEIEGINVTLDPGGWVSVTGENGVAPFPNLPEGTYTATIDTTNLNWTLNCPIIQTFTVSDTSEYCVGFGLTNNNPCTDPDVSIFAPSLRRCFSNRLVYVSACNFSTATGILDSSYVDVELDPLLTVNSASLPYTDLGNNTFRFETGDIYPGQCVNFTLSTTVSCNAQNGQTLCMDATLYPAEACIFDTIPSEPVTNDGIGGTLDGLPQPCTLPWDQSSLSVEGWCTGDSVYFSVTNTGDFGDGDMECYSPVWLTVDGVVTDTDSLMIQGGETVIYAYPASGQTFFLNAEQHPLHPGNSHPNAHVELCGSDSTQWIPDLVNNQPLDDADPVVDIYCGVVTGSYDPNDKTGYPLGVTDQNFIHPNRELQYVVRFQNTGTDTAFTVVIRDTLDTDLNIFTVNSGASSHEYTFQIRGQRILEWTFNNILLPDSTTNEPESNGFVTFTVDQVPNLPEGTLITNQADIYFDLNAPIITNQTEHRISYFTESNPLELTEVIAGDNHFTIYPNPNNGLLFIEMDDYSSSVDYTIFDFNGRPVLSGKLNQQKNAVYMQDLTPGAYVIQIDGSRPVRIIKK